MKIESKYDIGQDVYWIFESWEDATRTVSCDVCTAGKIIHAGKEWDCPACKGTAGRQERIALWLVKGPIDIGLIGFRTNSDHRDGGFEYMQGSSGSGTVYSEDRLFPSRQLAQEECERRNKGRQGVVK